MDKFLIDGFNLTNDWQPIDIGRLENEIQLYAINKTTRKRQPFLMKASKGNLAVYIGTDGFKHKVNKETRFLVEVKEIFANCQLVYLYS